eukprot:Gregarina_sp_Poly_1__8601@NODE_50_length_17596_cov_118_903303_g43_i0_p14_GENE_NODE_50_length_17596_cov_118_903303_g43_i0NODE_50_length_17596_cov_118_903303_g43_i0_p14_ORF_typecomplete_len111_score9_68_NODE_50_length_17596_cov_118_903303_g43_i068957227
MQQSYHQVSDFLFGSPEGEFGKYAPSSWGDTATELAQDVRRFWRAARHLALGRGPRPAPPALPPPSDRYSEPVQHPPARQVPTPGDTAQLPKPQIAVRKVITSPSPLPTS